MSRSLAGGHDSRPATEAPIRLEEFRPPHVSDPPSVAAAIRAGKARGLARAMPVGSPHPCLPIGEDPTGRRIEVAPIGLVHDAMSGAASSHIERKPVAWPPALQ